MNHSFSTILLSLVWLVSCTGTVEARSDSEAIKERASKAAHRQDESYQTEFNDLLKELEGKSSSEIFNKANRAFHDHEYSNAIQVYRVLNTLHPFSEYAEKARSYSIQAHYNNQEMNEAISEAHEFIKFYPTSQYLEAVSFLIADAYLEAQKSSALKWNKFLPSFMQLDFAERSDTSQLTEAAYQFAHFLQRFPQGAYREKAQQKLDEIHQLMIKKEYLIAHFYCKRKNYLAAYNRITTLLERYPNACDILSKKHAATLVSDYQYAKKQLGLT